MVAGINVAPAQEEEYEHGREMYRQHESDVPETTNEQSGYYHEQARERAEQQRRQQQQRFDEEMRELAEQEWRQQQQLGERGTARPNPPVPKPLAHDSLSLPICDVTRNGSRALPGPAPSRDDFVAAEKAMKAKDSAQAYQLLRKIDQEGMAAIAQLPPSLPWIDVVIDKQLDILSWARAKLAVFNDRGIVVHQDDGEAAKWYQKSIDTKFVDEIHGCEISGYPGATYVDDYAVMLLYGRGVPKNEKKAKEVLANGYGGPGGDALLVVLHNNALPKSYEEFLGTNVSALAARLPRNVDKRSQ
jgi:hypothetical protein